MRIKLYSGNYLGALVDGVRVQTHELASSLLQRPQLITLRPPLINILYIKYNIYTDELGHSPGVGGSLSSCVDIGLFVKYSI